MKPVWPKELTDVEWQKKKGTIAKITSETGIGAALTKAQREFAAIKWDAFGKAIDELAALRKTHKDPDAPEVDKKRKANFDEFHHITAKTILNLQAIEKLTDDIAKKWKSNKAIPSASVAAVTGIGAKAKAFRTALDDAGASIRHGEALQTIEI